MLMEMREGVITAGGTAGDERVVRSEHQHADDKDTIIAMMKNTTKHTNDIPNSHAAQNLTRYQSIKLESTVYPENPTSLNPTNPLHVHHRTDPHPPILTIFLK